MLSDTYSSTSEGCGAHPIHTNHNIDAHVEKTITYFNSSTW